MPAMSEQACSSPVFLAALAGLVSGTLLGFLFRRSDAERKQDVELGFRHRVLRALHSPIWSLPGLISFVIAAGLGVGSVWLPLHLTVIVPLCRPAAIVYKLALMAGVFVGWFIRYLVWRAYLRHL